MKTGGRPKVIADACNNHKGDLMLAKMMILSAWNNGADYIKFQLGRDLPLKIKDMVVLKNYADQVGIEFLCTPFNKQAVDDLEPFLSSYKIGSAEALDFDFVEHVKAAGKHIFISTGAMDSKEVAELISLLGDYSYTLLQCTSIYPTPHINVDLNAMVSYKEMGAKEVGLSDHTQDLYSCFAAVALGASVVEKHFIMEDTVGAKDAKVSITPPQLKYLVRGVSLIHEALGSPIKQCYPEERKVMEKFR